MRFTYEVHVTVNFSSKLHAKAVYNALIVEVKNQPTARVLMEVVLEGEQLKMKIASSKRASLRASLNSFLRLLTVLESTEKTLTEFN
ncbi:MAG: KEOPS complex subunit Pcc1 [Thermofilaceae archaeon]